MNHFKQHIPNFVDGVTPEEADFDTLTELFAIPVIQRHASIPNFYRFSLSENRLMAEYKGGKEWWVVGYLSAPVPELPEWEKGR